MPRLLSFLLLVSLFAFNVLCVNDVIVKHNRLFVDGQEYIIKGMSYNPAPISLEQKTGLCSFQQTFHAGTFESHCYDSDFWDGNNYPDRLPTRPPERGWFSPLWERDLPRMAAMGVNTLRLYNANPSNHLAYQRYNGMYGITLPGKNHVPFFDACHRYGLKILWPLFSDVAWLLNEPEERLQFYMRTAIEEVGNHPALLMYALGNEFNYVNGSSPESWRRVLTIASRLMNYARDYQRTYWGRLIPFTTGTDDNNLYYDWLASILPVDVFMPNAGYRGRPSLGIWDFFNLWSGNEAQNFSGWHRLSCKYQIPVLIGEMNPVGYENPPPGSGPWPTAFPQLWRDLIRHIPQGAIGGFFFEWTDELWKAVGRQDQLGLNSVTINCVSGIGCSNDSDVFLADHITPKDWQYQAVCCGSTDDGRPYNFNTDPFELLGRRPYSLENTTQECPIDYLQDPLPVRFGYVSQYSNMSMTSLSSSSASSSSSSWSSSSLLSSSTLSTTTTTSTRPLTTGIRRLVSSSATTISSCLLLVCLLLLAYGLV